MQAYRYALDLTPVQEREALSHIGASRFAYNFLLSQVKAVSDQRYAEKSYGIPETELTPYFSSSHYSLRKYWNTQKEEVAPWWGENSKEAYSDGARRVSLALKNFFDSRSGKRAGPAVGFPKFKKRSDSGSVRFGTGIIRVESDRHHVTLPRLGKLKTHESTKKLCRKIESGNARILAATLVHKNGKWYVSFTVETARVNPVSRKANKIIGVDLGIKTLYTGATPEGNLVLEVGNPKHTKHAEALLRRAQRKASRRQAPDRGTGQVASNRRKKANRRVQRIHLGIANRRLDLIRKVTTDLAKNYDVIVVESLNVAGLIKNRHLSKAISDVAWGEFTRQLKYKTAWYGSTLVEADRFYPSSKTCSGCKAVKAKLLLSEREYACSACGLIMDRDVNAAVNLAKLYNSESGSGSGRGGKRKLKDSLESNTVANETSISQQLEKVA